MKKTTRILFSAVFIFLSAAVFSQTASDSLEIPVCPATASETGCNDHEVHRYSGFALCFRDSYKDAEWVGYTITKERLVRKVRRTNKFREDESISTGSAKLSDYKASGYDRGHLAPAADMSWREQTESESFLLSNITPQAPLFNRGIWKELESKIRSFAQTAESVTVITGPVLEKDAQEYSSIGESKVRVPEYFYKVILANYGQDKFKCTGFIIPNTKCDEPLETFAVAVDEVEKRTGLDFFSALDDSIEEAIEASTENLLEQTEG
ncbi:DNA/RNA non-specific endonuclease [Treponema sp.]|uniref:DNA/RNA non-specific endonuclease n=1 Tax=Treponema sp. TaxID=166 RepID=UPI003F02A8B9